MFNNLSIKYEHPIRGRLRGLFADTSSIHSKVLPYFQIRKPEGEALIDYAVVEYDKRSTIIRSR